MCSRHAHNASDTTPSVYFIVCYNDVYCKVRIFFRNSEAKAFMLLENLMMNVLATENDQ